MYFAAINHWLNHIPKLLAIADQYVIKKNCSTILSMKLNLGILKKIFQAYLNNFFHWVENTFNVFKYLHLNKLNFPNDPVSEATLFAFNHFNLLMTF